MKTIVFDFDGTIADTFHIMFKVVNEYCAQQGYTVVKDPHKYEKRGAYDILTNVLGISAWKLPYLFWKGKKVVSEEVKKAPLFPGIKEVLHELKEKYAVGVLTSNKKETVEEVLKKHGVEVDFIFSSGLFNKGKKLEKLIEKQGLQKGDVMYIGDEIRDVKACTEVGIKMIGVSWGYNSVEGLQEAGVDFIAERVDDIGKIVQKAL